MAALYDKLARLRGVSDGAESDLSKEALANAARARSGQPLRNLHCLLRHGLARGVAVEGDMCGVGVRGRAWWTKEWPRVKG